MFDKDAIRREVWRLMEESGVSRFPKPVEGRIPNFRKYPEWMLVTERDEEIVGFITFVLDRKRRIGEIGNNAVKPKDQRRGIGTLQYQKVLEIFKEEEMKFASVSTGLDEAHAPARVAYEKVGFKKMILGVTYYMKVR